VLRAGDWKYIQFYSDGRQELYNLKDDIGETKNLTKSMPEKAAEMKARLDAVLKEHGATIPPPGQPVGRGRSRTKKENKAKR
jgi:arylsulfatase A-like enzyme